MFACLFLWDSVWLAENILLIGLLIIRKDNAHVFFPLAGVASIYLPGSDWIIDFPGPKLNIKQLYSPSTRQVNGYFSFFWCA